MAKATKQVPTKTKPRKPANGKRKPAAKALQANTAAVKRAPARKAKPTAVAFELTPAMLALRKQLRQLSDAAWPGRTANQDVARAAFEAAVREAMRPYGTFTYFRDMATSRPFFTPRERMSMAEIVELAVVGEFSLDADRAAASSLRRAARLEV
jgi:hypothetical protein